MPQRFPPIRINDYAGASIGQGGGQDGPSDDFYVQEVLTKIARPASAQVRRRIPLRHQHGGEPARRASTSRNLQFSRNFTSLRPNVATLTAADGGNAFASFLLGYMASTNVQVQPDLRLAQQLHRARSSRTTGALSNRLTLNAGLRWDYEAPLTETGNQVNGGFDPSATALTCPACPASGLPSHAAAAD